MQNHHFKFLLPILAALFLSSCAEIYIKEVDYAPARLVPETAHPSAIKFSRFRTLLRPGTEIGLEGGIGAGLGRFCSWEKYPVSRRVLKRKFETQFIRSSFADALEANGYDVVGSIDIDFRPEDELSRADYFVSARLKDVDLDLCHRDLDIISTILGFRSYPGINGKLYAEIDWSVYDALRRKVVYKVSTEGYSERKYSNIEGLELLFFDAFEMAAHNLAADEDFYNLIVEGQEPERSWVKNSPFNKKLEKRPRKFDTLEIVNIENKPLSRQPLPRHIEQTRKANVMIQKVGHGSGFFISKQGHILTNQHVVGDARRMRIVTKGKKHKLIAEVLRVDKTRDVALLKLEKIPKNLDIMTLPIRSEKLTISEDVYALGNPYDYGSLQDSVTKGIVSAHRNYKIDGVRMPFIQADVDVHGGNSGGSLLDENGNIVGITVSGISESFSKLSVGLNFFIPIADALKALDITLDDENLGTYPAHADEEEESNPDESQEEPPEIIIE